MALLHPTEPHTFTIRPARNYIIAQTVSDTMGCSSSISTSLYSNFIAPALVSESEVCGLDTLQFYTSMQNYAKLLVGFRRQHHFHRGQPFTSLRRKEPSRYPDGYR